MVDAFDSKSPSLLVAKEFLDMTKPETIRKCAAEGETLLAPVLDCYEGALANLTLVVVVVVFPQAPFRATNVPRPTLVSSNCATAPWLS